jgi:hypothetical protein
MLLLNGPRESPEVVAGRAPTSVPLGRSNRSPAAAGLPVAAVLRVADVTALHHVVPVAALVSGFASNSAVFCRSTANFCELQLADPTRRLASTPKRIPAVPRTTDLLYHKVQLAPHHDHRLHQDHQSHSSCHHVTAPGHFYFRFLFPVGR